MCYYMKNSEIIRLNMFCNRVSNKEAIKYWGSDRNEYLYKNFPSDCTNYRYIENENPEVIFLLIKNTKYFLAEYIEKEIDLCIKNIVNENNIFVLDKNLIKDFIYYYNENSYKISYFFQLFNETTGFPSKNFMRATIKTELRPSCWIKTCVFELFEIKNNIIKFIESKNRKAYVYANDVDNEIEDLSLIKYRKINNYERLRNEKSNILLGCEINSTEDEL